MPPTQALTLPDRRMNYAVVLQPRLLDHLLEVVERGCLGSHDCADCEAIRKGIVLAEPWKHNG